MSRELFIGSKRHKNLTPSHSRSKEQEKELMKRGSGELVSGSGCGYQKGDIKKYKGILRIEAKTTKNKSFSVTRDMIRKIEEAALPNNELPAMVIEFNDGSGNAEMEVAIVPLYVLDELLR